MSENKIYVGRRKTSVARLRLFEGNGKCVVNKRKLEDYFTVDVLRTIALQSFEVTEQLKKHYFKANVSGGGVKGQAEAIRLAVAKSLAVKSNDFKLLLKKESFLTRDPRMVERKKYGRRKARRKFQFSKR